jgi:hypothetical protein
MKVHLLRTPDYNFEDFEAVCSLLKDLKMAGWEFKKVEPFEAPEEVQFSYSIDEEKKEKEPTELNFMPWDVLFGLCKHYRQQTGIPATDLVVLLTTQRNELNWFSAFDKEHNIFVNTDDWEPYFNNCDHKYPVAHEIIANCLQQAMNLDLENLDREECIHLSTKGCMNDFCGDKRTIAIKMRTADICKVCLSRLEDCGLPKPVVDAASAAFGSLRLKLLTLENYDWKSWNGDIKVTEDFKIIFPGLDNREIRLDPIVKTLYLFFLKRKANGLGPITRRELRKQRKDIFNIYSRFDNGHRKVRLESTDRLIDHAGNSFFEKTAIISAKLNNILGPNIAREYYISGVRGVGFEIPLSPEKIDISMMPEFDDINWNLPPFPFRLGPGDWENLDK